MAEAVEATGRIDVLVNTAGLWVEGPTESMTEDDWDRVVNVNLKGTFFACSRAIPELKKTQGCIINLSSDCGLVGTPETAVYTASKGGISLLTKSLAMGARSGPRQSERRVPGRHQDADAGVPGGDLRRRRPGGLLQAPARELLRRARRRASSRPRRSPS